MNGSVSQVMPRSAPAILSSSVEAASPEQRDRALVERHRAGDRSAFDDFYREHSELVFNLTYRQCGDRDLACDLSQEIFLKIFKSLGRFRCRSSLKTWTYRVCLNHCRSRLGRRRPFSSLTREDGDQTELVETRSGPEELAVANDQAALLARALPQLDSQFREAVILRDLEDLSYQEVAEVLKVPIGTVRSRIARGREQLRKVVVREALIESAAVEASR
jgi:RNA polymerase sigma-70 factor (ECF subfamily)